MIRDSNLGKLTETGLILRFELLISIKQLEMEALTPSLKVLFLVNSSLIANSLFLKIATVTATL